MVYRVIYEYASSVGKYLLSVNNEALEQSHPIFITPWKKSENQRFSNLLEG